MSTQGFKPRKLHGSLSSKVRKFQEMYEEIMEEIQAKPSVKTELQCYSQNGSCVWHRNTTIQPSQLLTHAKQYYSHSAIAVVLNNDEKVIVDWNIGQFKNLKERQFIFVVQS